ncbi:alginate export family protein [Colwellia sp. MSW7]|uniref:Alginate export family protein n=1 Tax=Colwellia maritima TaxID=2912588 RepID=A0ABS9X3R1_9GAMM|nr:alginate export family protein [Colwellia maritima]MCI2284858.1 alginate export family protein [Colwellia maritima]
MKTKILNTNKFVLSVLTTAILAAPSAFASDTAHGKSITDALADSKVNVSFRARYEAVDEDGASSAADKEATAFTLKSRLTLNTGAYQGFSLGLEVDNVTAIVDDYNDAAGNNPADSVIADPEITDVNQAYIKYSHGDFKATGGRRRILHNNQRFVGGVGWRQNEQTYDGIRIEYAANDALSFDYSYIHNANRIFADDAKSDLGGDFHFINGAYKVNKAHKITAFAYILDFDTAAALSTSTFGALYNGKFDHVFVNASLATQSDNGDNVNNFDTNYINAEVGTTLGKITLLGGYELLGSDNGVGFSTPFATLHKFQGWTDKFLGTPGSGVEDIYVTVKGAVLWGKIKCNLS